MLQLDFEWMRDFYRTTPVDDSLSKRARQRFAPRPDDLEFDFSTWKLENSLDNCSDTSISSQSSSISEPSTPSLTSKTTRTFENLEPLEEEFKKS
uniref:Uncharacterized protein n=1 Tax=Caenorhabditis japonica TaxID=281687 RepID=A0A8R1IH15_CAEJA